MFLTVRAWALHPWLDSLLAGGIMRCPREYSGFLFNIVKCLDWHDRISVDPRILVGNPVVKGTRISVEMVVDLLAAGWTREQIQDSYPTLKADGVLACLRTSLLQRQQTHS